MIEVGMIGYGTVGQGVASLLIKQARAYGLRVGAEIKISKVLVRDRAKAQKVGFLGADLFTDDAETFFNTPMQIVVEVAGGRGAVEGHVRRALEAGKHVVTANKAMLAEVGAELFTLAREHGCSVAFEASCGGGIPIVTSLKFGMMANRIDGIYGILNGTCNYMLTEMSEKGKTYFAALKEAQEAGFAEADPFMDVSGLDAAQKLAILASLAFNVKVVASDVWHEGIDQIQRDDIRFGQELGYELKLLAIAERNIEDLSQLSLRVHPCFLKKNQMMTQVRGSFNAVSVYGHAVGHVMLYGRGAGMFPTASAVVGDLLNVAGGWYSKAFNETKLVYDQNPLVKVLPAEDLVSRHYIRFNAKDVPGVVGKISTILGEAGLTINALRQHEKSPNAFVPLVFITGPVRRGALERAFGYMKDSGVIDRDPVAIRLADMPGESI